MPFHAADQPGTDSEGFLISVEKMDRILEQQVLAPKIINLKVSMRTRHLQNYTRSLKRLPVYGYRSARKSC